MSFDAGADSVVFVARNRVIQGIISFLNGAGTNSALQLPANYLAAFRHNTDAVVLTADKSCSARWDT